MKLLAIETSTEACSAALYIDGEILEHYELAPKTHAKIILPMIDKLMADANLKPQQLDALAFGRGPGSFTGVRIATGVIQGIAFGADLPVVPVSTLAALAQDFFRQSAADVVYTAMDARIAEIFWGVYQRNVEGLATLIGEEMVIPPSAVQPTDLLGTGIGSGWAAYQLQLLSQLQSQVLGIESDHLPRARAIATLGVYGYHSGQAVAAEAAMPVYLRDKVAQTETERATAKAATLERAS